MALINCPGCNKEIATEANVCPHCGFAVKMHLDNKKFAAENREKYLLKTIEQIADDVHFLKVVVTISIVISICSLLFAAFQG